MKTLDQFNFCSSEYSKIRPHYPESLFQWINQIVQDHQLALDCGTGNGQAANGLSHFFNHVIAIDSSENQLKNAINNPKIEYQLMSAEKISLDNASVDLITSASSA